MSLSDSLSSLQEIDYSDISSWPTPLKLISSLLVGVLILTAIYFLFYVPKLESLESAQKQEQTLKQEFKDKQKLAINLPAYQEQMVEIKDRFENVLQQLPDKSEVPALLTDISEAGLEQGLEFKQFKPSKSEQKQFYVRLPINIQASGSYHELASFISAIANFKRIVTVGNLEISSASAKTKNESAEQDAEPPLNFKANIYTYHFTDVNPDAQQGAATRIK